MVEREEDISQGELYDWRGEIGNNHKNRTYDPQEAQNLISLCSAGYLDKGEFFRTLHEEYVEKGSWSPDRYEEVFSEYVQNNPFVVFVRSNGMDPDDVYTLAFDSAIKIKRFPASPNFIDICGKGDGPIEIVERALEKFRDKHSNLDYERIHQRKRDQYIIRINTDSL